MRTIKRVHPDIQTQVEPASHSNCVTYIIHVPGCPILPAEVDEGVVGLLDVHLTFALVRGHCAALHGHLAGPKLHQVLAGGAAGPRHHAGEQSSRGHDEMDRLLQGQKEEEGLSQFIHRDTWALTEHRLWEDNESSDITLMETWACLIPDVSLNAANDPVLQLYTHYCIFLMLALLC